LLPHEGKLSINALAPQVMRCTFTRTLARTGYM
jgi:hypothetical protein